MLVVKVTIKTAYWLKAYLYALGLFCEIMGMEPDPKKLDRMIARGIKVKAEPFEL
jgi:hypothetical protein